ncbi:MAG: PQQ-binding-like beta-propeller repeat protein [Endomicrobiia bacterium]|nr:PQQ-binding-like beta-propeller repeat protein [Endomicrobiia bacterium]
MTGNLLSGATVWDWMDHTDLTSSNSTFYLSNWNLNFAGLREGRNYVSAGVFDGASNFQTASDVFFVQKDTTPPSITKNSTWDETRWCAVAPVVDVDFNDAVSGSGLGGFDVRATTDPAASPASWLTSWVVASATATFSFTENWTLPQTIFDAMLAQTTNYCWTRTYDLAGNTTTVSNYSFYVKKDTAGVSIADNEGAGEDAVWRSTSTERAYRVHFYSLGTANLESARYTAYTQGARGGQQLFNWTEIPGFVPGAASHETDWYFGPAQFEQLRDGATNYISAMCWNTAGSTVTLDDVFVVKKDTTPPATPILSAPLDASATGQVTVNFAWLSSADLASGTSSYALQISTDTGFGIINQSTTTSPPFYLSTSLPQCTYYWRVSAKDFADNQSVWSAAWSVQVDTTPPATPTLSSPADGFTTNYAQQIFAWTTVSDSGPAGLSHYRIEIATSAGFVPVWFSTSVAGNSLSRQLADSATYWWRVSAVDRAGNSAQSGSSFALVIDTIAPSAPVLSSPLDGYATNQTMLSLVYAGADSGPAGLSDYTVEISTKSDFVQLWYSTTTTLASHTTGFTENIYRWRVMSRDRAGNYSSYSSTRMFAVDISSPFAPSLILPANDTRTSTASVAFQWSAADDAGPAGLKHYEIEVSTDANFGGDLSQSSATLAQGANLTLAQSRSWWRVRTLDNAGNYSISASSEITIDLTKPYVADNQTGDDNWRPSAGTFYDVDFFDLPASSASSGLRGAEYIVYLSTNSDGMAAGTPLTSWRTIFSYALPSRTTHYTDNWNIDSVFGSLAQGYNFVFVRSSDIAGNTTDYASFVFYVKKDTAPPVIINNEPASVSWDNAPRMHNVDFRDDGIGVKAASYTVYGQPAMSGAPLIGLTTIFALSEPQNLYAADWGIDFALLSPGTNYVSLGCRDDLGNVTSLTDVFRVLKDTIPPDNVTNLAAGQGSSGGEISLSWTSSADDAVTDASNRRTANYLLKYKTSAFSSPDDFLASGATFYIASPSPPSVTETATVTGLVEGTTYWLGILPKDKANNYAVLPSSASAWAKRIPPAQITTLVGSAPETLDPGEVFLSWVAVGDNVFSGDAKGYEIRYATYSFGESQWTAGAVYDQSWGPLSPESQEEKTLIGLTPGVTYWFGIKAYDFASPGANYSVLSNTVSVQARPSGPADGILCYGEGTLAYPRYYRTTSAGASWTGPSNANNAAATIYWSVLKACPVVRNEKVLATLSSGGQIYFQRWDGGALQWSSPELLTTIASADAAYRPLDIAYEQTTGRAMVVWRSATTGEIIYRIWSSTAASWVTAAAPLTVGGTALVRWVRLEARPGTNEIMLVTADANGKMYAYRWNGSSWANNALLTTGANVVYTSAYQCYDVAWETTRGNCLILWGQGTSTKYAMWSTTASVWGTIDVAGPNIAAAAGANWIKLAADSMSGSNRIAMASIDTGSDWNVAVWNQFASSMSWTSPTELSATCDAATPRLVDIAWEKDTGRCISVGILSAAPARNVSYSVWSSASNWSAVTTYTTYDLGNNTDLRWLALTPDPNSNKMILLGANAGAAGSVSLRALVWTGSDWAGGTPLAALGSNGVYEFFALAFDKHDTVAPSYANYQTGDDTWRSSNSGIYNVDFFDAGGSKLSKVESRLASSAGGAGVYRNYTDELTGLNSDSYTSDWNLSAATWGSLTRARSYVSLKIYDSVGNNIALPDAFYVQKDTEPPTMTNNLFGGLTTWHNVDPQTAGRSFNITFNDQTGLSLLTTAQYFVNVSSNQAGVVIATGTIFNYAPGGISFSENWNLNGGHWELLRAGTNYVTVNARDLAGNASSWADAFVILKDTVPPAALTDLSASRGTFRGSVDLSWTPPGDNGAAGDNSGGAYLIKYATYPITTLPIFNSATTLANNLAPKSPSGRESITITGLDLNTTYYFCVRTRDKVASPPNPAHNWSDISNSTGSLPRIENIHINEIFAQGAGSWVELYSDIPSTQTLNNWKLIYNQGSIVAPGGEATVWTGIEASSITPCGFLAITGLNLDGGMSYHVKLLNDNNIMVDIAQWPVLASGQSLARISDGNTFFEKDPTPTQNAANAISTSPLRINEIDYSSSEEFVEIYNVSASTLAVWWLRLRNSAGVPFVSTRTIYPQAFAIADFSSVDGTGKTWSVAFGASGFDASSDFAVLENAAGQVVDRVTWQTGAQYLYRNYKAEPVSFPQSAPASAATSIGRYPSDGNDAAFAVLSARSYAARNYNPSPAASNTLAYPPSGTYIPRRAKIALTLGENSSSGKNNALWFVRTGGATDDKSPHAYRLADIGFDPSLTSPQTAVQVWLDVNDTDGGRLVNGAVYKITLVTDNGSAAAPALTIDNVAYDASTPTISAVSLMTAGAVLNVSQKAAALRIGIKNNSPVGAAGVEMEKIEIALRSPDDQALTDEQAQNLFEKMFLIPDSDSDGKYLSGFDTATAAELGKTAFEIFGGTQIIHIDNPDGSYAMISPQTERFYFLVVELSSYAHQNNPPSFKVLLVPSAITLRDAFSDVTQPLAQYALVVASTPTIIAPAPPPAGTQYPAPVAPAGVILNDTVQLSLSASYAVTGSFVGGSDGILRNLDSSGTVKWNYNAGSPITEVYSPSWLLYEPSTVSYITTQSGDLVKIKDNTTSAQVLWSLNLNNSRITSLTQTLDNNNPVIFAGTQEGRFYKIDKGGAEVSGWQTLPGISGAPMKIPTIDDWTPDVNAVWFGTSVGGMYRLENVYGTKTAETTGLTGVYTSPYLISGKLDASLNTHEVFFGSDDGKLRKRTSSNLTSVPPGWTDVSLSSPVRSSPWYDWEASPSVYFGCDDGKLYKANALTGQILWSFATGGPIRTDPIVVGGKIYFGSDDGYFYGLDAAAGARLPKFPVATGGKVRTSPVYDSGPPVRIYFGSTDGKMYCVEP